MKTLNNVNHMRSVALALLIPFLFAQSVITQTGEITPGDNLVVEGIPKIPAPLAEELSRYQTRSSTLLDWHPSRREMLISTRFGDTAQVHVVKSPGGYRKQLTFFADPVSTAYCHPKRADYFIFGKDSGGNGLVQLYRYDLATGDVTLLTDGIARNTDSIWSNSGGEIVYRSSGRNGRSLRILNPSEPKSDRLLGQVEGAWFPVAWSPDDRKILVIQSISVNERSLWLIDATTGEKTPLLPGGGGAVKISYDGGEFSRDGKGVYVTTDRDSEFLRLAYIDLASKRFLYLTDHIKWNVEQFALSPDGKIVAFVTNENGISRLRLLDTKIQREKRAPQIPIGVISGIRWHAGGTELGFAFESARSPLDVYSLNIKNARIERWTFSETGSVTTEQFAEPELVSWKSFDGRMVSGFLYRPPARFTGKRPVIVDIHGGPELQARPGFLGGRDNYLLNELGVAFIFPNIRGSSGYGKTFLTLDNGLLREDAYKDIGALLDWIKTRSDVDADRIMVSGVSYGAGVTLAVATRYNDLIRCSWAGAATSNIFTLLLGRPDRRSEYGDERDPNMRAFFERIAPLNRANKITKPLFILVGKNDPITPPGESEQMLKAVKKNGTPVWYMMANDEGHGYVKKKNLDFVAYATVLFVKQYLLK